MINIEQSQLVTTGMEAAPTSFIYIKTNNTLAQVLVTGYLSSNLLASDLGSLNIYELASVYCTDVGMVLLKVINTGTGAHPTWSLSLPSETSSGVTFTGTLTPGNLTSVNNASGIIQDSGVVAANTMQVTGINTMQAGSRIILAKVNGTEAANAVTASGNAGVITTSALTTAGAGSYAITWTNTLLTTTSVIGLTLMGGTNTVKNITMQATAGAATSTLTIYNNTAASALNGTLLIGYTVW